MPLESAFSLGQNQAQQIQTQTHGPYGLHKVMIEGHRSLEALYSNPTMKKEFTRKYIRNKLKVNYNNNSFHGIKPHSLARFSYLRMKASMDSPQP